jgi:GR25 family glycosyltransferase involved in LPS biosynthesis
MKITDFFDKTVCINLDRRFDRWSECVAEFEKNKLVGIERFKAVDGNELQQISEVMTPSRTALVLTNIQIIEDAIQNDYESILILEDDVEFTDELKNINEYFNMLPEDWDMLYFGGNHNTHIRGIDPPKIINDKVCKLHNTFSTHCVAINKKAYQIILDRIKLCDNPLDVIYANLQKTMNVYCFYPAIATQRISFSDIENRVTDYKWLIK